MTPRVVTAVLAAALCAAAVGGCSSTPPAKEDAVSSSTPAPRGPQDPDSRLRERPSFEAAQQQYLAAVTDTANRITALVPGLTWTLRENSWQGCGGDFVNTKGVQAYVFAAFSGPTPESLWPQALQIVKDAAARLGATNQQAMADKPANREVVLSNSDGVEVTFGTAKATILSALSDCRLRQGVTTAPAQVPSP